MRNDLDFRVLGPVRVLRGQKSLPIGGVKRRSLLALLIAGRNRVVSVSTIADGVWEDNPPPSVTSSIQVSISGLRTALGDRDAPAAASLIETAPPGYRLRIESEQCDVGRFHNQRIVAMREQAAGRLESAAGLFRAALGQWSGRAYDDLLGMRFADDLAVELEEQRQATMESRVEVDLALGRHRELVSELGALTADYPLRESLWAHYMVALYRCGRQADALAAFRLLRKTLLEELGLEPSAEARKLEAAILAQADELDWQPPGRTPLPVAVTERETADIGTAQLRRQDGSTIPIGSTTLRIGRLQDNELVIEDPKISRHHAAIVPTRAGYLIADLHSANGTRVNQDQVLGDRLLASGDEITIGSAQFEFLMASDPSAP